MRSLRGRDQEKVVRKKEELWGQHAWRGWCTAQFVMHCDPWPLAGVLSALTWGKTWQPQWKDIFLYCGDLVCNNTTEYLQLDPTHETCCLMDVLMGGHTQITKWFFFFFPKHCDCIYEKLHPILYLCNTEPCLALWGVCDWHVVVVVGCVLRELWRLHSLHHSIGALIQSTLLSLEETPCDHRHTSLFLYTKLMSLVQSKPEYCFIVFTNQLEDDCIQTLKWVKDEIQRICILYGLLLSWLVLFLDRTYSFFLFA